MGAVPAVELYNPLPQASAHAMVRRRALAAGIQTLIDNHTFRATGITAYLKNGGTRGKRGGHGQPCFDPHTTPDV